MRFLSDALKSFALVATVWAFGLVVFVRSLPHVSTEALEKTEAMVVLTGGMDRIPEAVRLLDNGLAEQMMVSGVSPGISESRFRSLYNISPTHRVFLGYRASSTQGNADETAAWIQRHGFRRVRLVTAYYHMPRSLLLFQRRMPMVTFVPYPIVPGDVPREDWWRQPRALLLLIHEYHKYMTTLLLRKNSLESPSR